MTFGWGVEHAEMYSRVLENLLGRPVCNGKSGNRYLRLPIYGGAYAAECKTPRSCCRPDSGKRCQEYDCQAEAKNSRAGIGEEPEESLGISLLKAKVYDPKLRALQFFAVSLKRVAFVQEFLVNLAAKPHSVNRSIAPKPCQA